MAKTSRFHYKGDPLVIPRLQIPKKFHSARQYRLWTRRCRDVLIKYHRFSADDFIRIADTDPCLNWHPRYMKHWREFSNWEPPKWSGYVKKLPPGAIIYWPDGCDFMSEAHEPRDVIFMLEEIQHWMDYDYDKDPENRFSSSEPELAGASG